MAQFSQIPEERKNLTSASGPGNLRTLPIKPEMADREEFGQAMQMKRDAENAQLMPGGMPQRPNVLQRKPADNPIRVGESQDVAEQEADMVADEIKSYPVSGGPAAPKTKSPNSGREGVRDREKNTEKESSGTEMSSPKQQGIATARSKAGAKQQRGTAAPTAMTRSQFEQIMRTTYGVTTIRDASHDEQVHNNRIHLTPPNQLPNWSSWGPGTSSFTYNKIVDGFAEFARVWGGVPVVNEINFMRVNYIEHDGVIREYPNEAASFGAFDLNIYQTFESRNAPLPAGRSTSTAQASLDSPDPALSGMRTTVHELSHGIGVAAAQPVYSSGNQPAPIPMIFPEWNAAIGWYQGQLYDLGVAEVQNAIAANTAPPSQFRIHRTNWNNGNWIEQPVSAYATTGPGEDFAESVMTYTVNPNLLQQRSPARYNFIHSRRSQLRMRLRVPTPAPATTPNAPSTVANPTIPVPGN